MKEEGRMKEEVEREMEGMLLLSQARMKTSLLIAMWHSPIWPLHLPSCLSLGVAKDTSLWSRSHTDIVPLLQVLLVITSLEEEEKVEKEKEGNKGEEEEEREKRQEGKVEEEGVERM